MASIDYVVGKPKHLELSKRIAEIIRDELDNQIDVLGNAALRRGDPSERTVRWEEDRMPGFEELPVIMVSFSQDREDAGSTVHREDTMRFMIDVYERGTHLGADYSTGYNQANKHLQNMLGFIHQVIYHPNNRYLGFPKRFVNRIRHEETNVFEPATDKDSESVVSGRFEMICEVDREFTLNDPQSLNELDTKVRIDETDEGYYWVDNV